MVTRGAVRMNATTLHSWAPRSLSLLRIIVGLPFLEHGLQKFLGFPPGEHAGSDLALDNPGASAGIVAFVAGALVPLGRFLRPARHAECQCGEEGGRRCRIR